ncbi:MAG: helix-hairpin-helix domain-containing protein [Proteobacteria bacterium]|nr:helix-hairpin-helix domain-containing protein [Pseudomonadota bacterium]
MKKLRNLVFTILVLASFPAFSGPVNINKADAAALSTELRGIGMSKAEAIVAYRKKHGLFKSADDLAKVKGIGLKTISKNRQNILLK